MATNKAILLTKFIKGHNAKMLTRGISIFLNQTGQIKITGKTSDDFSLQVPSQSSSVFYAVHLEIEKESVVHFCDCPAFDDNFECKHCVAAALYILYNQFHFSIKELIKLLKTHSIVNRENLLSRVQDNNDYTNEPVEAPAVLLTAVPAGDQTWRDFSNEEPLSTSILQHYLGYFPIGYSEYNKVRLISFDQESRHWTFLFQQTKNEIYRPEIKYDGDQTYSHKCNCIRTGQSIMCRHVRITFEKLVTGNTTYFLQFKDWTSEKLRLLKPYGLSMDDKEAELFHFHVNSSNKLQINVPPGFLRGDDAAAIKKLSVAFRSKNNSDHNFLRPVSPSDTLIEFEIGYVFNLTSNRLGVGFEVELVKVYHRNGRNDIKKLSLNNAANLPLLKQLSDEQYNLTLKFSDENLLKFLEGKGYGRSGNYANSWAHLTETASMELHRHYLTCISDIWPQLAVMSTVFLLEEGSFSSKNCKPFKLSPDRVRLSFEVKVDEKFISIWLKPLFKDLPPITIEDKVVSWFRFLFRRNHILYLLEDIADLTVAEQFKNNYIKVPLNQKKEVLKNIIAPLQDRYPVSLPPGFEVEKIDADFIPQILLKEFNEQFLMFQPQFQYNEIVVDYKADAEDIIIEKETGSMQVMRRDIIKERQFFELLRPLHESFNRQYHNDFFYVHFKEVMKGQWFLHTIRYLQQNGFIVRGMENLKRFRYNTNVPKWEMKAASGIDWFDLSLKVSFGAEEIPFKDLRKAIINNQNIVVLGDGSFGVLPEEWLKQYSLLFKMSEVVKDGSMRLNKLHFTLIDQLHEQIDDEAVLQEIKVKREKLKNIDNIKLIKHSKNIKATLRPYQLSGFQWLQTLNELGWGGCLADDMGLGKTLQAITFLQFLKEKYPGNTNLVICPVSLIYNWETELKKFAPKLRYHIYYGSGREFRNEHFEDYDIILTSYGLVRSDMEQMLKFHWNYIILDESQAIKNPEAKITKALQLLKANNRLILSGTPVQNNTFDLFAQFNFLNPGILGNKEFFRTEFANPIDKNNDAEKAKALRQLLYPFLLRRTKEQVVKDLPGKTETILWCQLPKEQRGVYEGYKNHYREMLLKKIEEEGMAKAGMYVLEGLLRLRQICDSPRLLEDAQITTTQSIKTEELLREVEENTGEHKLLVFSQFTEMLHLIKEELEKKNISFCYLDGRTLAKKRKEAVEQFQTDPSIKIFLISIKAGGVGLNLTAADYVYIVDPWWNPAVEQQAIDRTHRIGQNKKIFAYKMICRDTVEEKIIQLQQRKKQLANDLVTEDAGFIKKLTRQDVEFLFT